VSLQTGINTKDLAAAAPTYAEIIEIIKKVLEDNALAGRLAWLISPAGWEDLSTTSKQASGVEGNFILGDNGRIAGYDYRVSNQVTAEEYFFGDWSQVLLGEWGGLEMNVDPYTHSLKGKIRYITFKTCDVAVRHPEAFCYAHDGIA
jgi:HK97 family phage major capsid protein